MNRGGAEKERKTQNQKQAQGSELSAESPMQGSNSLTARLEPEPKPDAQPTEPPRRPYFSEFVPVMLLSLATDFAELLMLPSQN